MNVRLVGLAMALGFVAAPAAPAQTIHGEPGSPSATVTIDGKQIPPQPQTFKGKIERSARRFGTLLAARALCRPRAHPTCC